tara:strand:+ start:436 stop:714 length:279 start_codon:yes stop_codon:yes gene_type:complete
MGSFTKMRNNNRELNSSIKIVRTLIEEEGWNPKEAMDYLRITQATWFSKWDTIISKKLAKKYVLEYERPLNKIKSLDPDDWYKFDHIVDRWA